MLKRSRAVFVKYLMPMEEPKGTLLLIGGAEEKADKKASDMAELNREYVEYEILKKLIPSKRGKIAIITTASRIPEEIGETYTQAFSEMGFENVTTHHIKDRMEANDLSRFPELESADTIFLSGGNQFRLSTILGGTAVNKLIFNRYCNDENFTAAGTSAGAMAMSKVMLYEGHNYEAMLKGDVKTAAGLGLIDDCIIDTHLIKRGRFIRLTQTILTNPACLGIGLGEDTAVIVRNGNEMECIGSGMVIIIDGKDIKHTNIADGESGCPLYVENLTVHILVKGNGFILDEKKFLEKIGN
jgi:cyanophycinase